MTAVGTVRRQLFGVPSAQAVFETDGFSPLAWARYGDVARTLVHGYHAALVDPDPQALNDELHRAPAELMGVAYEGAGMGLAALDLASPVRRGPGHVASFLRGPAVKHVYPFYIGVGMAYARLGRSPERDLGISDPLFGWITLDGYGFHEAFFRRQPFAPAVKVRQGFSRFGQQLFDQGVGRALWFSLGGNADLVALHLTGFQPERQRALWSGAGLASSYCGGEPEELEKLRGLGSTFRLELAVGASIAAWGRDLANSPAEHTNTACQIFAGRSAEQAAGIACRAQQQVRPFAALPTLEQWRQAIALQLTDTP